MLRHDRDSRLFRAGYKHSPQVRYIASSVLIGVLLCGALWTDELLACSLSAFSADVTGFRSIGRINENNRNAFAFGLIFDKGAKLIECPRVMQSSLSFPQLLVCSFPDVRQVFKSNGGFLRHSFIDYLTTDPVVDAFLIARLASFEPCHESAATAPSGSASTACFRLNRPANPRPAQSVRRHFTTRKLCSVRENGEIGYSHINTDYHFGRQVDGIRGFNDDIDKVVFALLTECRAGGVFPGQSFALIITDGHREAIPAACQCETDDPILFFERENAKIIVNACGAEDTVASLLFHQTRRDAGDGADGEIGGKPETGTDVLVTEPVQFKLSPDLVLAPIVGNIVTGISKGFKCVFNLIRAMDNQLAFDGSYTHREHHLIMFQMCQQQKRKGDGDSSAGVKTPQFPRRNL